MGHRIPFLKAVSAMNDRIAGFYRQSGEAASNRRLKDLLLDLKEQAGEEREASMSWKYVETSTEDLNLAFLWTGSRRFFSTEYFLKGETPAAGPREDEDVVHQAIRCNQEYLSFLCEWRRVTVYGDVILGISAEIRRHNKHLDRLNGWLDSRVRVPTAVHRILHTFSPSRKRCTSSWRSMTVA